MLYGYVFGRKLLRVTETTYTSPQVPAAFNGYKIVHISDLHLSSFSDSPAFLQRIIDTINAQQPDLICFTGDFVGFGVEEAIPFTQTLRQLHAKDGIMSVLGNHDFALYHHGLTDAEKEEKVNQLTAYQRDTLGWQLLRNQSYLIHRDSAYLQIIGVDNTSCKGQGFQTISRGDLMKAIRQLGDRAPKKSADFSGTPQGERQEALLEALRTLNGLAKQLRAKRFEHGAINFETPEVRFLLDEQGNPTEIIFHRSNDANHLIEEFMLLANRIVAKEIGGDRGERLEAKGERREAKPFVYRVHDVPDPEKLVKLGNFIRQFGFHLRTSSKRSVQNKHINSLLDSCQGTNSQTLIETLAIRSMAKAVYSTSNIGHYGLAFPYYTHFTSPIRRYPDMMVHRLLSRYLLQSKVPCRHDKEVLEEACVHCSDTEQMAQMAERDSIKEMQARWMSSRIGEEFDGVISGVTEFGLFVQLRDTLTEGLVPIRTIAPHDYMQYDEENYCLIAARSGKTYTLSDSVRVRVTKADVERKQIDFVLVEDDQY